MKMKMKKIIDQSETQRSIKEEKRREKSWPM